VWGSDFRYLRWIISNVYNLYGGGGGGGSHKGLAGGGCEAFITSLKK